MSSTPSNTVRLSSANGAARRIVANSVVDVPVVHRRHGDDLLGDDVERVAGIAGGLDGAVVHRPGDGGAGHEVAAELREDDALR